MARVVRVAAAQLGGIQKTETRTHVVERMLALMRRAKDKECDFVVFPELCLTTFFPRYNLNNEDSKLWYEREMPGVDTIPLFEYARENCLAFYMGYAELFYDKDGVERRYNTSITVGKNGQVISKYRKVHLPGHGDYEPERDFQHLEKKYFEVGDTGFEVFNLFDGKFGMCICNDRRWPETYRVMGLQGVEMILVGYNTPALNGKVLQDPYLKMLQSDICLQSGAYQNSTWVVAVAKSGMEDGHQLMGGTCIVAPTGEIVARATTLKDELVVYDCDLDECNDGKENMFNFKEHRRPEYYKLIVGQ